MATKVWKGGAVAVAQVTTLTPANVEVDDVFTATINGKDITVVATAATVANVVGLMVAAWNASNEPEFAEITATDTGTEVTLTGDTPGKPFTVAATEADGGGVDTQTFTASTTTAATGPNHWSNADNWDTGSVPVNSDDVYFVDSAVDCLYGLDQSAVTLTSLHIRATYVGKIGLPLNNTEAGTYVEYRERYLKIGATTCNIGSGEGNGSQRIKINFGSVATTTNVNKTSNPATENEKAVELAGTSASNVFNFNRGSIGVSSYPGLALVATAMRVGYILNQSGDVDLYMGESVAITTLTVNGGQINSIGLPIGIVQSGGTLTLGGTAAPTSLTMRGGTLYYNCSGTLGGNAKLSGSAVLDFSRDQRTKTVTNPINLYGSDARIIDRNKVVSSLVVDFEESADEGQVDFGTHVRLTRGTPS